MMDNNHFVKQALAKKDTLSPNLQSLLEIRQAVFGDLDDAVANELIKQHGMPSQVREAVDYELSLSFSSEATYAMRRTMQKENQQYLLVLTAQRGALNYTGITG